MCTYVMPYNKRALIFARNVFLYAAYRQGERHRINPNGKKETRHHVGRPFGREFSAFVIIAEL